MSKEHSWWLRVIAWLKELHQIARDVYEACRTNSNEASVTFPPKPPLKTLEFHPGFSFDHKEATFYQSAGNDISFIPDEFNLPLEPSGVLTVELPSRHDACTIIPENSLATHTFDGEISFGEVQSDNKFELYKDDKVVVSIDLNTAKVTICNEISVDEASQIFWESIHATGETKISTLEKELETFQNELRKRIDEVFTLQEKIRYLKMLPPAIPDESDDRFKKVSEEF